MRSGYSVRGRAETRLGHHGLRVERSGIGGPGKCAHIGCGSRFDVRRSCRASALVRQVARSPVAASRFPWARRIPRQPYGGFKISQQNRWLHYFRPALLSRVGARLPPACWPGHVHAATKQFPCRLQSMRNNQDDQRAGFAQDSRAGNAALRSSPAAHQAPEEATSCGVDPIILGRGYRRDPVVDARQQLAVEVDHRGEANASGIAVYAPKCAASRAMRTRSASESARVFSMIRARWISTVR
jgi:hypothetical protein